MGAQMNFGGALFPLSDSHAPVARAVTAGTP